MSRDLYRRPSRQKSGNNIGLSICVLRGNRVRPFLGLTRPRRVHECKTWLMVSQSNVIKHSTFLCTLMHHNINNCSNNKDSREGRHWPSDDEVLNHVYTGKVLWGKVEKSCPPHREETQGIMNHEREQERKWRDPSGELRLEKLSSSTKK